MSLIESIFPVGGVGINKYIEFRVFLIEYVIIEFDSLSE